MARSLEVSSTTVRAPVNRIERSGCACCSKLLIHPLLQGPQTLPSRRESTGWERLDTTVPSGLKCVGEIETFLISNSSSSHWGKTCSWLRLLESGLLQKMQALCTEHLIPGDETAK